MPAVKPASTREPVLTHRNLPLLLLLARERVIGLFRPILHAHGLTEQQWRIVRVLVEFGALEPRQIGRLCALSSPSLAGILARMQEQGLIARAGVAHDKRRQAISATPRSRRLAARLAPEIAATYRGLEQRLGEAFVHDVYRALDGLIAALPPDAGEARGAVPAEP